MRSPMLVLLLLQLAQLASAQLASSNICSLYKKVVKGTTTPAARPPQWIRVYARNTTSVDMGRSISEQMFSYFGLMRRDCSYCVDTHKTIYYKRLSGITKVSGSVQDEHTFSIYNIMKNAFSSHNNLMGSDFDLYSSYYDLMTDSNSWMVCRYNEDKFKGYAFPSTCGPLIETPDQWNANLMYFVGSVPITTFDYYILSPDISDYVIPVDISSFGFKSAPSVVAQITKGSWTGLITHTIENISATSFTIRVKVNQAPTSLVNDPIASPFMQPQSLAISVNWYAMGN